MNKIIKNFFLWAFVILLSVSFIAYFGVTGNPVTGSQVIGSVDGYPILNKRMSAFSENYNSLQQFYQRQGYQINDQIAQSIAQEAFRQAIIIHLLSKESRDDKIFISDKDIVNNIKQTYFNNDLEEFKNFKETGELLVQKDMEDLTRDKIYKQYFEESLKAIPYSKLELEEKIAASSIERVVLVAVLNIDQQIEKNVNDEILEKYFQDNITRYQEATNQVVYQDVKDNVQVDYFLENRDNLIDNIRNDVTFKFQALSGDTITANQFKNVAKELDMEVTESLPLNFYSKQISDKDNTALFSDQATIRKIFTLNIQTPSEVFQEQNNLYTFFVIKENIQEELSSFVKKRYLDELKNNNRRNLFLSLYNNRFINSEVVFGQPDQQQ